MPTEIERKFLIAGDFSDQVIDSWLISQGYLSKDPHRSVRIRILAHHGFLTIKSKSSQDGTTRGEWEYEIPIAEARELITLCLPETIEKTRHLVKHKQSTFEVDVFHGVHQGLVIAEIELASADQPFDRPEWLGAEVTGDPRYYNANLSQNQSIGENKGPAVKS